MRVVRLLLDNMKRICKSTAPERVRIPNLKIKLNFHAPLNFFLLSYDKSSLTRTYNFQVR